MTRYWYLSTLITLESLRSLRCVSSLSKDTAFAIQGLVKPEIRRTTSTSMFSTNPSKKSTEELRRIAEKKGYDTNGMDRNGLEMIAAEFQGIPMLRPSKGTRSTRNIEERNDENSGSNQINGSIVKAGASYVNGYSTQTRNQLDDEYYRYAETDGEGNEKTYKETKPKQPEKSKRFWLTKDTIKSGLLGMVVGPLAVSPVTFLHNFVYPGGIITNQLSQFEFDTLTGGFSAAGFAILYRHFIKEEKDETLANGVVGASILARSFSKIQVMYYCDNLDCGEPLIFMDWNMIQQLVLSMSESLALFGAVALVLESFCDKGFISRIDAKKNTE